MLNIMRAATMVAATLTAVPCLGQTTTPRPPVQWSLDLTGYYEFDTNPLRVSLGGGDSHWRIFPSIDIQAPLNARTTLFARSSLRRDQYAGTPLLNGLGATGTVGIARRMSRRVSLWGAYDLSRSEQPDVLEGSPLRFASYTQQGGSAGLTWRLRSADVVRTDGFAVRRQYRGLSSLLLPASSSQVDPVLGFGGSWTHTFGGSAPMWSRLAVNTMWHRSNNPAYSYALPSGSAAWGTRLGADTAVRLDGTLAWLRYDARQVGRSGVLRRDTITELRATFSWRTDRRVAPFVRVSQQWDRSTDPSRTFSDSRVLVGARVNVGGGGRHHTTADRRRIASDASDSGASGSLGPDDSRSEARTLVDQSYADIKAERWSEATEAARAALALEPTNATAWANLGVALYKLGDVAGARQAMERSLTLNPTNDALRSVLAQMPRVQ